MYVFVWDVLLLLSGQDRHKEGSSELCRDQDLLSQARPGWSRWDHLAVQTSTACVTSCMLAKSLHNWWRCINYDWKLNCNVVLLACGTVSIEVPSSCFVCVLKLALRCHFSFIIEPTILFAHQYCSSFLCSFCILESDDVTAKSSMLIGNKVTNVTLCTTGISRSYPVGAHAVTCARGGYTPTEFHNFPWSSIKVFVATISSQTWMGRSWFSCEK